MEYETVLYYDDDADTDYEVVEVHRYPIDLISWSPTREPQQTQVVTRIVSERRTGWVRRTRPVVSQSPRQDATSAVKAGQGPKTRGDTDEFISAFWVKGKPKCRRGYRYDFRRKMCRLIK